MALPQDGSIWPSGFPIFDFTLKFEETILEMLPSSGFLFFGSAAYIYYRQQPVYIRHSPLLWLKLVCDGWHSPPFAI